MVFWTLISVSLLPHALHRPRGLPICLASSRYDNIYACGPTEIGSTDVLEAVRSLLDERGRCSLSQVKSVCNNVPTKVCTCQSLAHRWVSIYVRRG